MYYVIIGASNISIEIMSWLMQSGAEVTILEKNLQKVRMIQNSFGDVCTIGDPLDMQDLNESGLGRADMVIASLENDHDNLIVSQISKQHFSVARVVSLLYSSENKDLFSILGVDVIIEVSGIVIDNIQQKIGQFLIEEI